MADGATLTLETDVELLLQADLIIAPGGRLVLESGVTVSSSSSFNEIIVQGTLDGSGVVFGELFGQSAYVDVRGGGTLELDTQSQLLGGSIELDSGSLGTITNNHFGASFFIDVQSSAVTVTSNSFDSAVPIETTASIVPRLYGNTFNNAASIRVLGSLSAGTTTWDSVPNFTHFLIGDVTVPVGSELEMLSGTTVKTSSSFNEIIVQGTLDGSGVVFGPVFELDARSNSVVRIHCSTIDGDVNAEDGASLDVRFNDLSAADIDASALVINDAKLDNNFWGSKPILGPDPLAEFLPCLAITTPNVSATEGDSGSTSLEFVIVRSGAVSGATTVDYAVSGSGVEAASGIDFSGSSFPSSTVTFQANELQKVISINVAGDLDSEADETFTLTLSNGSNNAVITTSAATGTILNDDDSPGFTIVESGGSTGVSESGTTDTFTVVLDAQPSSDVVLSLSSNKDDEATVSPGTLTFTSSNWDTARTVTVTGVDDDAADGSQTATITVSVDAGSSDDAFDGVGAQPVSVSVSDDDSPGFMVVPQRVPYLQDFSAGKPAAGDGWEYYSGDPLGRIEVVSGALRMDASASGTFVLNEAVLHLDLHAAGFVELLFDADEFADEEDNLPPTFAGRANGDGVAVSGDGVNWVTVVNLVQDAADVRVSLSSVLSAAGITDLSDVRVKFQQYDNFPAPTDGWAFDNIRVRAIDFGDAPDNGSGTGRGNYRTTQSDDGPSHTVVSGLHLGASVDGDDGTLQNSTADADDRFAAGGSDDEDGVLSPLDLQGTVGAAPTVTLLVTNTNGTAGTLAGWIDYDRDGVFEASERATATVSSGTMDGRVTLTFPAIPSGSAGSTYARFRLSTDAGFTANASSVGGLGDGEVEDYAFAITSPSSGVADGFTKIASSIGGGPMLANSDRFGSAVAVVGDLDGDGVADLAAGAYQNNTEGSFRGAAHVLMMNANGTVKSSTKIGSGLNRGPAFANFDAFGISLSGVGDLDGDGVADLAVGAHRDGAAQGAVHVLMMNTDGTVKSSTKIASGLNGGPTLASGDFFGNSVSGIGDLDGNGVADLAVGAYADDTGGTNRGAVYVVFLNADGTVASSTKIDSTTPNGPTLANDDLFGSSVTAVGDLDGNGVTDVAVGAIGDDTSGTNHGAVHVLLLNADGTVASSTKIDGTTPNGPTLARYDLFGSSVTAVGDLDGNSVPDLAVGAPADYVQTNHTGAFHVLFLNADGTVISTSRIDSTTANGPNLSADDDFGSSAASIGDLDGDGVADLAVGAIGDDTGSSNSGAVYILNLAPADTTPPTVAVNIVDASLSDSDSTSNVTFVFSEPVTGFSASDVTVSGGTLTGFSGSGSSYSATFTTTDGFAGTGSVTIVADSYSDAAGNSGGSGTDNVTIDRENPLVTVTIVDASLNDADPISNVTFTFSESTSDFVLGDVSVSNGTLSNFSGSGTSYSTTFTATDGFTGTGSVTVDAGSYTDGAGNSGGSGTDDVTIDLATPVASIVGPTGFVTSNVFDVTVSFGELVSGFSSSDVTVGNGSVTNVADDGGGSFTVTIDAASDGEVTVDVDADLVTDDAGNTNTAASGYSVTVDTTSSTPVLMSISASSPTNAALIPVSVSFGESVTGFVSGDVSVVGGSVSDFTGSGGSYSFNVSPSGDGLITIDIAAGAAVDAADNETLAAARLSVTSDRTSPTLLISPSGTTTTDSPIQFTFQFDEAVTGFTSADVDVTNGSKGTFTIVDGDTYRLDVDPVADGTVSVSVSADAAQDSASNGNAASNASVTSQTAIETSLVGVDFQSSGESVPANWNVIDQNNADFSARTFSNLIAENGQTTNIELTVGPAAPQGMSWGSSNPAGNTVPLHNPSLSDAGGVLGWTNSVVNTIAANWSGLAAAHRYDVYVFAVERFGTDINQTVTISGSGVDDPAPFIQATSGFAGELLINGQQGDSRLTLENFALTVTADSAGEIDIQLVRNDGQDNNVVYIAGLAIQPAAPSDLDVFLPDAGGGYEVLVLGTNLVLRASAGDELFRRPVADVATLTITGSSGDDNVQVLNGDTPVATPISFAGGDGNDRFDGSLATGPLMLLGNGGDDVLIGGSSDDVINGGSNKDELIGGPGNDDLNGGGSTGDTLEGGDGNDKLNGGSGNDIIREMFDGDAELTNTAMTGRGTDMVISAERAILVGGNAGQTIDVGEFLTTGLTSVTVNGAGGDDSIVASQGSDVVIGGGGSDTVEAGDGNDRVFGGGGPDSLVGGPGNDVLKGLGASGDRLIGGPGDDVLNGGRGIDRLIETADADFVLTNSSLTGAGNDIVQAMEIAELNGGESDNVIDVSAFLGFKGFTVVRGNGGDDSIIGSAGPDVLNGGDGDDTLLGKESGDTLNGENGNDAISGHDGADLIEAGVDHDIVFGGNDADTINGDRGYDILVGGSGDDQIEGRAGRDTLVGGTGEDNSDTGDDLTDDPGSIDEVFILDPLPGWVDQV